MELTEDSLTKFIKHLSFAIIISIAIYQFISTASPKKMLRKSPTRIEFSQKEIKETLSELEDKRKKKGKKSFKKRKNNDDQLEARESCMQDDDDLMDVE